MTDKSAGAAALYLILHKVRGEPTFDIAHKLEVGNEVGWIIPTSGWRAYPWRHWLLEDLKDTSDINYQGFHDTPSEWLDRPVPPEARDHYEIVLRKPSPAPSPAFDISLLFS